MVVTALKRFYLRQLNGRKTNPPSPRDQRAVKYFAYPDWKFDRLGEEFPDGRYEAGADIGPDEWTTLRIDIDGTRQRNRGADAYRDQIGTRRWQHWPIRRHR